MSLLVRRKKVVLEVDISVSQRVREQAGKVKVEQNQ